MKKTINFQLQAKGGAGKSLSTYLLALKNEENERSYFVDLDSSVQSSTQQLKFLQGKSPPRFAYMNLLDSRNKIDRQLLFFNLQELVSKENYDVFFLDLGAPESDQLPSLFSNDYSIEEFKQIEDELNCKFVFNIIVAGGASYQACTTYLQKIVNLLDENFEIFIFINQGTFTNHPHLIKEIIQYAEFEKDKISGIRFFGDFDVTTAPHKNILQKIEQGLGLEAYQFIEKIKIKKEISKL